MRVERVRKMVFSDCCTDMAEDHELATEKVDTALAILRYFDASIFTGDGCWANPGTALCAIRQSISLLQCAEALASRSMVPGPIMKRQYAAMNTNAELKSLLPR